MRPQKPHMKSHFQKIGTKQKIWTLSFIWYPMGCCRSNGVVTTTLQSPAFYRKIQKQLKMGLLHERWKPCFLHTFFQNALIFKQNRILTSIQLQMATVFLNLYVQKGASRYDQPMWSFINLNMASTLTNFLTIF